MCVHVSSCVNAYMHAAQCDMHIISKVRIESQGVLTIQSRLVSILTLLSIPILQSYLHHFYKIQERRQHFRKLAIATSNLPMMIPNFLFSFFFFKSEDWTSL